MLHISPVATVVKCSGEVLSSLAVLLSLSLGWERKAKTLGEHFFGFLFIHDFFLSTCGAIIIYEIIMIFLEGIGSQKRNSCISQYRVNVVVVSPAWKQYCNIFMGGLGCIHSR